MRPANCLDWRQQDAIGKRLDERVRGLDWGSLTQSGGPLSRDMEIFYPENRFINFYIVPLMIEHREASSRVADAGRDASDSRARGLTKVIDRGDGGGTGRTRHDPARHHGEPTHSTANHRVRTLECAYVAGGRRGARNWQSTQLAAHPFTIDGAQGTRTGPRCEGGTSTID